VVGILVFALVCERLLGEEKSSFEVEDLGHCLLGGGEFTFEVFDLATQLVSLCARLAGAGAMIGVRPIDDY
jgi:hypothetical protein